MNENFFHHSKLHFHTFPLIPITQYAIFPQNVSFCRDETHFFLPLMNMSIMKFLWGRWLAQLDSFCDAALYFFLFKLNIVSLAIVNLAKSLTSLLVSVSFFFFFIIFYKVSRSIWGLEIRFSQQRIRHSSLIRHSY